MKSLLVVALMACISVLAGCDDVTIERNPEIPIPKHATWAWRPAAAKDHARGSRPVISEDVISRGETIVREKDAINDITLGQLRVAIQQTLASKGFTQVSDPDAADFLVDYHVAVRRHNVTVERVYPGAYPGLLCGPFDCWEGWGWGPPQVGYEHIRFREGTIVFDFVQRSSNRLAYRAVGQKPVHRETFSQEEITGLIHHLLKDLKPGK
jgi:hypothetical protein